MTVAPGAPGEDEGPPNQEDDRLQPPPDQDAAAAGGPASWRSETSDEDVDAAFAAIISGIANTDLRAGVQRHPSAGAPAPDTSEERTRRRELRRLERAEEVAAFAAQQAEEEAEREADEAHFVPPEPPPLPRPKGRTIGAALMLLAGFALLVQPSLLAVGFDLALIISVVLILGGAAILLTGIWQRHNTRDADGWDDGAQV